MVDEVVAIVDEADRVIGCATRSHMRRRRLRHRAVYILVFDSRDRLLIHQRVDSKDVYPGYWDVAFGGVVGADEEYHAAAVRELAEEAGIDAALQALSPIRFEDATNRIFGLAYRCRWDGEPRLQESEVQGAEWVTLEDVSARAKKEPFCPDGLAVLMQLEN